MRFLAETNLIHGSLSFVHTSYFLSVSAPTMERPKLGLFDFSLASVPPPIPRKTTTTRNKSRTIIVSNSAP